MDKRMVLYAFPLLLASLWSMAAHSAAAPQVKPDLLLCIQADLAHAPAQKVIERQLGLV